MASDLHALVVDGLAYSDILVIVDKFTNIHLVAPRVYHLPSPEVRVLVVLMWPVVLIGIAVWRCDRWQLLIGVTEWVWMPLVLIVSKHTVPIHEN